MELKKIELLNLSLLIGSFLLAIYLPFRLFLISYAVLGPLHYLTEIFWLRKKDYFLAEKKSLVKPLIILTVFGTINPIIIYLTKQNFNISEELTSLFYVLGILVPISTFFVVLTMQRVHHWAKLTLGILIIGCITFMIYSGFSFEFMVITMLLTTLVHVYFFTLLFMFYGARKNPSKIGFFNCALLVLVPVILILWPIEDNAVVLSKTTQIAMEESNFLAVGSVIATILDLLNNGTYFALGSAGIKIQIFIAFAYTYHYLNWFSKTSIIGWNKLLTKKSSLLIFIIWVIALILYYKSYALGFTVLFFISLLHVFMEFPLNIITMKSLFKKDK